MGTNVMQDAATPMSEMAAAQTRGWAARHGMPMADLLDADISSSGWIRGTNEGSIDKNPPTSGARQATGASDISSQPNAPVTTTATSASGKSLKVAGILTPFAKYYGGSDLQKDGSGGQICRKCGSRWITGPKDPALDKCRVCSSAEVGDALAKSAKLPGDSLSGRRDETVKALFAKAAKTTDKKEKATIEKFAQWLDALDLSNSDRPIMSNAGRRLRSFGERHAG